jgi:4-alpha-glucanotransferase
MQTYGSLNERQAGILMPVSSIPSDSGIGDFGDMTRRFIDDSAKAGFKIWQILPLNPVGYGNSPYQPYSSFAGDEIYINLDELKKDGLLKEVQEFISDKNSVDYEAVRAYKTPYFKEAYEAFKKDEALQQEFADFEKEAFWLDRYALFRVLKDKNNGSPWTSWPEADRTMEQVPQELADEVGYQKFLQFIFTKQWKKILEYAHEKFLTVVGDMPIYVGGDSADVWQFQDSFLLDEQGRPQVVAGVPPDYFSATGQLWGNPIYDWKYLKEHDYDFWIKRFDWNRKLFDVIRIDHFIGFDRYWQIPADSTTAISGHYEDGPSYSLFDVVFDKLPDLKLIAEDLGVLRPEVHALKNKYDLLGMRIAQYSMGEEEEKENFVLPEACIVYTGTHDNDPVNGWYQGLDKEEQKRMKKIFKHLKLKGKTPAEKMTDYSLKADSRIAIIPMQDLLNLEADARINTPGTIGTPNWQWRASDLALYEAKLDKIKKELKNSHRLVY